jgi:biopolymer transport protein ExbD
MSASFGFAGRRRRAAQASMVNLNLTPMIDMFVILLVFLIKSYSATPTYLTNTQGITLADTQSEDGAPDKAALIVGKDGLILEGSTIIAFEDGKPSKAFLKAGVLEELKGALEAIKEKDADFTGTLILQADKDISFDILKPILRTAGVVGYFDIKFAGVLKE